MASMMASAAPGASQKGKGHGISFAAAAEPGAPAWVAHRPALHTPCLQALSTTCPPPPRRRSACGAEQVLLTAEPCTAGCPVCMWVLQLRTHSPPVPAEGGTSPGAPGTAKPGASAALPKSALGAPSSCAARLVPGAAAWAAAAARTAAPAARCLGPGCEPIWCCHSVTCASSALTAGLGAGGKSALKVTADARPGKEPSPSPKAPARTTSGGKELAAAGAKAPGAAKPSALKPASRLAGTSARAAAPAPALTACGSCPADPSAPVCRPRMTAPAGRGSCGLRFAAHVPTSPVLLPSRLVQPARLGAATHAGGTRLSPPGAAGSIVGLHAPRDPCSWARRACCSLFSPPGLPVLRRGHAPPLDPCKWPCVPASCVGVTCC